MFEDLFRERLETGLKLLESGGNLTKSLKQMLVARSLAVKPIERFDALLGHARVMFKLKDYSKSLEIAAEADAFIEAATEEKRMLLRQLKEESNEQLDLLMKKARNKKRAIASAIAKAGGEKPGDDGFIEAMKKRANEGLVEGGWDRLTQMVDASLLPKSKLIFGKKVSKENPCMSKIGGQPFATAGEAVPKCAKCKDTMEFSLQVIFPPGLCKDILESSLLVLYTCQGCLDSFEPDPGTFKVRNYTNPDPSAFVSPNIKQPKPVRQIKVENVTHLSEPLWKVLQQDSPNLAAAMTRLYPPDPSSCYGAICGEQHPEFDTSDDEDLFECSSSIGGYAHFYNGEYLSYSSTGKLMQHLLKVESIKNYFCWADDGFASLYFSPADNEYALHLESS